MRHESDAKRNVLDEKRRHLDELRSEYQHIQRNQFDAEKKVAVADSSGTKPAAAYWANRRGAKHREDQRHHLDQERILKEKN